MVKAVKPKWPKKFTHAETEALKKQLIKDGHRMTKEDFAQASGKLVSGQSVAKTVKISRLFHYDYIRNAIKRGKQIPPSVLKDYPRSKYPSLYK